MAHTLRELLLVSLWALASVTAYAQEVQEPPRPTEEEVQAQLDALEVSEAENRDELLGLYGQALQELLRAEELEKRAADFEHEARAAPTQLELLREELDHPPRFEEPEVPDGTELAELEGRLQEAEGALSEAQAGIEKLAGEADHRGERRGLLGEELARVRAAISEQETELLAVTDTDATGVARRTLVFSTLTALRVELRCLEGERAFYEAAPELPSLQGDRAQRQLVQAGQLEEFWRKRSNSRRQEEADETAREAERKQAEIATRFPALGELAARNQELAALRSGEQGLPARNEHAHTALSAAKLLRAETLARFRGTSSKIAVGGLRRGMGQLLRQELEWTSAPAAMRAESEVRLEELSWASLEQIQLKEERFSAGDTATRHQALMTELTQAGPIQELEQLSELALELITTQRSLQKDLIDELDTLIRTLIEHERVHTELLEITIRYRAYIEERILWVPSTVRGLGASPGETVAAFSWLLDSEEWALGLERTLQALRESPALYVLLGLLIAALLLGRGRLRRGIANAAEKVRSYRTDAYVHTARALLDTVGLALPIPLLLWTVGTCLVSPLEQVEVASAVGEALRAVGPTYFLFEFLRQVARTKGLGEVHFRWSSSTCRALRGELRWFIPVALPLDFLLTAFEQQSTASWRDSAGRLAFMALIAALTVALARFLRRDSALLEEPFRQGDSLLKRLHRLWFGVVCSLPIALIALALAGYYYAALQFSTDLRNTIGLAVGLVLVNALLLRWLFVARRRLAIDQARQRAQMKAEAARTTEEPTVLETGSPTLDEDSVDIPALDAQTRELFRSGLIAAALLGLFFIWISSFPALKALDRVQLWPELTVLPAEQVEFDAFGEVGTDPAGTADAGTETTGTDVPAEDATAATATEDRSTLPANTTLGNVALALVILIMTAVVAKNAPGVLEIALLQRLPLDSGSRHALSTLFRYLILIVGTVMGLGAVGIGWGNVQWLAAALTFGLGFGLQEIFANFVSGIIILIERPVRVGDIVTVAGTEGRVTKLRMRATTILDWDRRELLVPNKEFITGSLTNWSLSDAVTRLVVPVGIAYGSNTKLARELLMQVAEHNELVLEDPAPSAIFRGFGASSLDFDLRVFMASRDFWPAVIDGVHSQIDDAFRAAGIEIAFPQRDLHIRSAEGLRGLDAGRTPDGAEPR